MSRLAKLYKRIDKLLNQRDNLSDKIMDCEKQIEIEKSKYAKSNEHRINCSPDIIEVESGLDATVFSINVNNHDMVKKGDTLLILETMKMEIPLVAPTYGTIEMINTCVGDNVSKGDILVFMRLQD